MRTPTLKSLFGDDAVVLREKNYQLLLLTSVMAPLGNVVLSPILDSLIAPLGASIATIGLMISVFWAPSLIVIPTVGILADRYGRKPVFAPALILFGVSGTLIAFTTNFWIALGLRFLQGIGWAGFSALIVTSIGDLYVGSKEGTAQGLRQSVTGLAGSGGSLIAGTLVVLAWQYPFFLYLLAIPVAAAVFKWFDEPTTIDGDSEANWRGGGGYGHNLLELVRQRRVLMIVLANSLPFAVFIGFLTYNSVLVVRLLDGSPAQAGVLYALVSMTYAGAASQVGRVTSIVGDRYQTLLGANLSLGGGIVVVFMAPNLLVAVLGVVFVGIGFGFTLPIYRSLLTGFAPESLRGGLVSLGATSARIGGVVTPVAMGTVIAAVKPVTGFAAAVQLAGVGVAIVGGGGGVLCVLAANTSSAISNEQVPSAE